jgi:tRNA (adenine37-N6)-methyltransferase
MERNGIECALRRVGIVVVDESGFRVQVDTDCRAALTGLDGFSHVQLLWWAHYLDADEYRSVFELPKPYKAGPDTLGVFATRSPLRPNPIAITNAAVTGLDVERGVLRLAYIDAEDGTPVVDIKPYHPATERIRDVSVPDWCSHWPKWMEESAEFDWAAEFENAQV